MTEAFDDLAARLVGYPANADPAGWDAMTAESQALIRQYRDAGDSEAANRAWHLMMVAHARAEMCRLFAQMREGNFPAAWRTLEQVEKMCEAIRHNEVLEDGFKIAELARAVADWQALYPYTVFASPEIIIKAQECTICSAPVSPMRPCEHRPGRVYAGQLCSRRITDMEPVSIAIVRDPVQKYSVLIPTPDPHDYASVRFVLDRLAGPFSRWRLVKTTAMHDHALFDSWSRDGDCPCHSGMRYADCCALRPGVVMPHNHIQFAEPPPPDLPQYLLRRRSSSDCDFEDVTITPRAA